MIIIKLSKKQEEAIGIAIDVMETVLGNGIDSGESGELDFAIDTLIEMRNKSFVTKANEKRRKEYLKNVKRT